MIKRVNLLLIGWILIMPLQQLFGQGKQLTIDSCYKLAKQNYPLIKRADLIAKSGEYNLLNIKKGNLPQISYNGQATYQSDVTSISLPIPTVHITPLSKDQYKTAIDVSENIYDGGVLKQQQKIQGASTALENASLQKDLYDIQQRINQIYFSVILLKAQLQQNEILIQELIDTKDRVDASIANGAAYKTDGDELASEILLLKQKSTEINSGIEKYLQMLNAFISVKVDNISQLKEPEYKPDNPPSTNRPELIVFKLQNSLYQHQLNLIDIKNRPKLSAFAEGGYGKPGLNMLKNEFSFYYIGGIKLNWNISGFYTAKTEKKLLQNSIKDIDIQQEVFLFNNNFEKIQELLDDKKLKSFLETDDEIVALKEKIKNASKSKYENGVITLNDYLKEINAVEQAKLNKTIHQIQLTSSQYNNQFTTGN